MATFAPDATPRVSIKYVSAGLRHTFNFRGYRDAAEATNITRVYTAIQNVVERLGPFLPVDFTALSALYIPQDSSISHPVAPPVFDVGDVALSAYSTEDKIRFFRFGARSSGGSRNSFEVYGCVTNTDIVPLEEQSNYVLTVTESTPIEDAVNALNAQNLPAIDNTIIEQWYPYVTIKVADYWRRQVMKGAVS